MTVILLLNFSGQYSKNPVGRLLLTHLLKDWGGVTNLGLVEGQGASEDDKMTICVFQQGIFSDNYNETNSDIA